MYWVNATLMAMASGQILKKRQSFFNRLLIKTMLRHICT